MKSIMKLIGRLRNERGVATSLIEATATIAVGAVLASVAVGSALDAINDSKIQAASADVTSIGQGVITFYKDNTFFPLFKDGSRTGAGDPFFDDLVSESGNYPISKRNKALWDALGLTTDPGGFMDIVAVVHTTDITTSGAFGIIVTFTG